LIVGGGLLDASCFEESIEALRSWSRRPDATFWFAVAWAEGAGRDA